MKPKSDLFIPVNSTICDDFILFYEDGVINKNKKIHYCCLKYSIEQYHEDLFKKNNIAIPDNLSRMTHRRQAECFFGRYCATQSLLSLGSKLTEVGRTANGTPIWPHGTTGSLSHAYNNVISIATFKQNSNYIGIDIDINRPKVITPIINNIITQAEIDVIIKRKLPISLATTLVFSAKESLYKSLSSIGRRHFRLDLTQLVDINISANQLTLKLTEHVSPQHTIGKEFEILYQIEGNKLVTISIA